LGRINISSSFNEKYYCLFHVNTRTRRREGLTFQSVVATKSTAIVVIAFCLRCFMIFFIKGTCTVSTSSKVKLSDSPTIRLLKMSTRLFDFLNAGSTFRPFKMLTRLFDFLKCQLDFSTFQLSTSSTFLTFLNVDSTI
jgi:hypothetical protein